MPIARLSHLEIVVEEMEPMERFYIDLLGFEVTDRSERRGDGEMVFFSQDPDEHHQLVLRQSVREAARPELLDHIAFRVGSLTDLRVVLGAAVESQLEHIETVSHGSTWSIYVRDPEANRVEFFVDTPWPVAQPCRFDIDLSLSDAELVTWTENQLQRLELISSPY